MPLVEGENNSDIINQGIGPNPTLKAAMKIDRATIGSTESVCASSILSKLCLMKKKAPRTQIDNNITTEENINKNRLPSLSINAAPIKVATT